MNGALARLPFANSRLIRNLLRAGALLLVLNEIRGLILAAPVLYAIYHTGGTATAIWLGICSLGGIALSVVVPALALKKLAQSR